MTTIKNHIKSKKDSSFYPYTLKQSLRFNDDDSAHLTRTPSVTGDRKTWTWSGWVKRSDIKPNMGLTDAQRTSGNWTALYFNSSGKLTFSYTSASSYQGVLDREFRDGSSYYHIVCALDTTEGNQTDRLKFYINGELASDWSTSPTFTLNQEPHINSNSIHSIGDFFDGGTHRYCDGYLSEINFIDGQALDASSFGELKNGVWIPKKYEGTYGTNGFYLDFANSSNIGNDVSGNNNDWTPVNLVASDVVLDSPTNNWCVLNAIEPVSPTMSNGNLTINSGAAHRLQRGTIPIRSKQYYEAKTISATSGGVTFAIGVSDYTHSGVVAPNADTGFWGLYISDQLRFIEDGSFRNAIGSIAPANTTYTCAYDPDTGNLWIGDGTNWYDSSGGTTGNPETDSNPTFTLTTDNDLFFCGAVYNNTSTVNFGQTPYVYSPPTDYTDCNSQNLPEPVIGPNSETIAAEHFDILPHVGDGTSFKSVTGTSFQPDMVWPKARSFAQNHNIYDVLRGPQKRIKPNLTDSEDTELGGLLSFDNGGMTYGNSLNVNSNGNSYVNWIWKMDGAGVVNNDGTIQSTVSANVDAGQSIVSYSASGVSGTIGHGLNTPLDFVIAKARNGTSNWFCFHKSLGNTKAISLDLANTFDTNIAYWNNTDPTNSLLPVGGGNGTSGSFDYIAYCFHSVEGYSKFGSYEGNGSTDGPFIFCGFKPKWVLLKRTDSANNWFIFDSERNIYNVVDGVLYTDLANAESFQPSVDFLSNGIKLRGTNSGINANGGTYIYAAFAENLFKYSTAN